MRNAALLMASLLLGSMALAGGKRATSQGPSEQFATAEAMRVIPKGVLLLSVYTERFQGPVTAFSSWSRSAAASFNSHPGTSVGVAALVQRRVGWLESEQGLEVVATKLRTEREDVATPMRHRREPPRGGSVPHSSQARPKHWTRSGL